MTPNDGVTDGVSRRRLLLASGAAGAALVSGCLSSGGSDGGGGSGDGGSGNSGPLRADGSSTVYPITSDGSSVWNSNPPADDQEYWGPGQYGIDTDEPMADYFAGLYGFDEPFEVTVGLSHSGTGIEKVRNGQVDIGDSSASVEAELPDASEEELDSFTDHVVARDGQPIVVSRAIYEAGVTKLTGEQVRAIYRGEITNWTEVGGPDREIQAVGRAVGSGTDTAFRANMLGDPEAEMDGVDVRKGQNQQVATLVERSNNAIAYMALAFVTPQVPALALELDGTTYELGENLGSADYPLSRALHCYTWEGTSMKEAAFINMLVSEFGQQNFVAPNNYFVLPAEEREAERAKLPDQVR